MIEENGIEPDLIVLAGYKRRLSQLFLDRYKNKVINMYPGDITKKYLSRGKDACIQAIENGERSIRCSVYVHNNSKERFGPLIAQSPEISLIEFDISQNEEMNKKIREKGEWIIFPYVIHNLIANCRVSIENNKDIYIDGNKIVKRDMQL